MADHALPATTTAHVSGPLSPPLTPLVSLDGSGEKRSTTSNDSNVVQAQVAEDTSMSGAILDAVPELVLGDKLSTWKKFIRELSGLWQELVALCLLFGAEFAACMTLWRFDGQPSHDWPLSITVGTLVAEYSTILRMFAAFLLAEGLARWKWHWYYTGARPLHDLVLFDDATRGPWGAFCLLRGLKSHAPWQSLGCILVLLLVFVGPFEQEMLTYTPFLVNTTAPGAVPSVARTSIFLGQGRSSGTDRGISLTTDELASVNAGIFRPDFVRAVCGEISCAYGTYKSVGYYGFCEDISEEVQFRLDDSNTAQLADAGRGSSWQNSSICLPSGLCNTYRSNDTSETGSYSPIEDVVTAGLTADSSNGFDASGSQRFEILIGLPRGPFDPETKALRSDCSDADAGVWRCCAYAAASCSLLPSIQTYTGNIINGSFKEFLLSRELKSLNMLDLKEIAWLGRQNLRAAVHVPSLSDGDREQMLQNNYSDLTELESGKVWTPFNMSADTATSEEDALDQGAFEKVLLNQGKLFIIDDDFHRGLTTYFGFSFSGTLSGAADGQQQFIPGSGSGNGLLGTIHNYGNFTLERTQAVFDNISTSLTTHLRQSAGVAPETGLFNATAPKEGVARVPTTCVHIRWEWWALPGTVAVLTLIFCGSVLWTTSCSTGRLSYAIRSWKSSPLPLAFGDGLEHCNVAERIASAGELQHIDDLNKLAKGNAVTLQRDENGVMSLQQLKGQTGQSRPK